MACRIHIKENVLNDINKSLPLDVEKPISIVRKVSSDLNTKYDTNLTRVRETKNGNGKLKIRDKALSDYVEETFKYQTDLEENFGKNGSLMFQEKATNDVPKRAPLENYLNRFLLENGINTMSLSEYNNLRAKKGLDPLETNALADLAQGIIAIASDNLDGLTLAEETWHFVIEALWENPLFDPIKNDPAIRDMIYNTEVYKKNQAYYFSVYNNEDQVLKEILGKLLSMTTYKRFSDSFRKDPEYQKLSTIGKLKVRLVDIIKGIINFFNKKNTPEFFSEMNEELVNLLKVIDADLLPSTSIKDYSSQIEDVKKRYSSIDKNIKFLENKKREIVDQSKIILNELKKKQEIILKTNIKLVNDEIGAIRKALSALGFSQSSVTNNYGVNDNTLEMIQEILDGYKKKVDKGGTLNNMEKKEISLINTILRNNKKIQKVYKLSKDLSNTEYQMKKIEEAIAKNNYEKAIIDFLINNQTGYDNKTKSKKSFQKSVEDLDSYISNIHSKENININPNDFRLMLDLYKIYNNIITEIDGYVNDKNLDDTYKHDFAFLDKEMKDLLRDTIDDFKKNMRHMDAQLYDLKIRVQRSVYDKLKKEAGTKEAEDFFDDLKMEDRESLRLMEASLFNVYTSPGITKEPFVQRLRQIIQNSQQDARQTSYNEMQDLTRKIYDFEGKGNSWTKSSRKFYERKDGKLTGYLISDVRTKDFSDFKDEYFKNLIKEVEEYSRQEFRYLENDEGKGKIVLVTYDEFKNLKDKPKGLTWESLGIYTGPKGKLLPPLKLPEEGSIRTDVFSDIKNVIPEYSPYIEAVESKYKKGVKQFFIENTIDVDNVEEIKKRKKQELNELQYRKWLNSVEKEFIDYYTGEKIVYRSGELVKPSKGEKITGKNALSTKLSKRNDFSNKEYDKLSEDEKDILKEVKQVIYKSKDRIDSYKTWELMERAPQITKSALDQIIDTTRSPVKSNLIKNIKEFITDAFRHKIDDDYMANRDLLDNIVKSPPVRYISMLDKPEVMSLDLLKGTALLSNMSSEYVESNKILPEVQNIQNIVVNDAKSTTYDQKSSPVTSMSGGTTILGNISSLFRRMGAIFQEESDDGLTNLKKVVNNMIEKEVYGERYIMSKDAAALNKLALTTRKYISNRNLRFNVGSYVSGGLKALFDQIEETFIGKYVSRKDVNSAFGELAVSQIQLLEDFSRPKKTSKISIAAAELGIIDSFAEIYGGKDKSRATRIAANVLDYGGWRLADLAPKLSGMIAVGRGIKIIDGNYYTKHNWKGSEKDFNNATSLWEMIDSSDGKLSYDEKIPKEAINFWKRATLNYVTTLDETKDEIDKGEIDRIVYTRFLTTHMSWLIQRLERMLGPKRYDVRTNMMEQGYLNSAYSYMRKRFSNTYSSMINRAGDINDYTELEKEGIKRIISLHIKSLIVYAISLAVKHAVLSMFKEGDWDEDDPNLYVASLRFIDFILTRLVLENTASVSITTIWEYIQNPIAGLESLHNFFGISDIFDATQDLISGEEESYFVGHGSFYEDLTTYEKAFIKSNIIPGSRGLYENIAGGMYRQLRLGEYSGPVSSFSAIGTSYKLKNRYYTNMLVNDNGAFTHLVPDTHLKKIWSGLYHGAFTDRDNNFSKLHYLPTKSQLYPKRKKSKSGGCLTC